MRQVRETHPFLCIEVLVIIVVSILFIVVCITIYNRHAYGHWSTHMDMQPLTLTETSSFVEVL